MPRPNPIAATAATLLLAACTQAPPQTAGSNPAPPPAPQRAGQPVDPLKIAGHIAAARVAMLTGDLEAVRRNMHAMSEDMRRAMKLPDPARRIDRESARAATRTVPDVRSIAWLDRSNLLVRVAGAHRLFGSQSATSISG